MMVDNSSIWTSHKVPTGGDINKVTFYKMLKGCVGILKAMDQEYLIK